jgi:tRNA modification GTPase
MSNTTVAVLTPPGKSALAVLAVAGPRAWGVVRGLFKPRRDDLPEQPEAGQCGLGRVGDDVRDDAVLAVRAVEPLSLELHVHGGREVVRWLLELLRERGVERVNWQRQIALLEAITADVLSRTTTIRTADVALDQHAGALRKAIEAGEDLTRWSRFGAHLADPWRVVIAGAPNAGKSSLLNALAGYQRSIVAPTPGTTRDVVTLTLALDGWPVEFADTAGLREAGESLEEQGIEQAREVIQKADLCVWLLDSTGEPVFPPEGPTNVLLVVNKIDRPSAWDPSRAAEAVRVSATTGEGLHVLCEAISRRLVPEAPPAGAGVPLPGVAET